MILGCHAGIIFRQCEYYILGYLQNSNFDNVLYDNYANIAYNKFITLFNLLLNIAFLLQAL